MASAGQVRFHEAITEILPRRTRPPRAPRARGWLQVVTTEIRPLPEAARPVIPAAYLLVRHQGQPTVHALPRFPVTLGSGPGDLDLGALGSLLPAPVTIDLAPGPPEGGRGRWRVRTPWTGPGLRVGGLQIFDAAVEAGLRFELGAFRMALQAVGLTLVIESWLPAGPVGPARLRTHRLPGPAVTVGGPACALGRPCAAFLRELLQLEVITGRTGGPRIRVQSRVQGAVRLAGAAVEQAEIDDLTVLEVGPARLRIHLEHGIQLPGRDPVALACALPPAPPGRARQ